MKAAGLVIAGLIGALVLIAAVALVVIYTGSYNVAATEEHTSLTRWAVNTNLRESVRRRAADIAAPDSLTPEMIEAGARHYKDTCEHCHGGPGADRAEWASGMRPRPPHLTEAAARWEPEEIFWLAKHGIKMTGMPAFGPSHDDETLWNVAAFVKELPAMTPERYAELGGAERAEEETGHAEEGTGQAGGQEPAPAEQE